MAITWSRSRANWHDDEAGGTPIREADLDNIEAGILALYDLTNGKGDLIVATAANTLERLGPGSNGQILSSDSAEGTGLKWIAPTSGIGPSFSAHAASAQTGIVTATPTKVTLGTEAWDTDNLFASSTFTPNVAGKYRFTGSAGITNIGDGVRMIVSLYKNGASAADVQVRAGAADDMIHQVSRLIDMNGTTDFVELYIRHDHGSNRDVVAGAQKTFLCGEYVRS